MSGQVYFGNATYQTWIPAPATGLKASNVGWGNQTQLLNGRAFVKRSNGSHREFSPTWNGVMSDTASTQYLHTIKDFADGIYGSGPFYFNDPFAVATNLMPPHWAAPTLSSLDWPTLSPDITPTFVASSTANGFPSLAARYVTTGAYTSTRKVTLIIPSGFTLNFGWHGATTLTGSGIKVIPYNRSNGLPATTVSPAPLTAGGTQLTNSQFSGTTYSRVEIIFSTAAAATVTVAAMVAQVLATGTSVSQTTFLSGRGTTGIEFATSPEIDYYSSAIGGGRIGMNAKWIEV